MLDLHRHDECSAYDGFNTPEELAVIAKEKGLTSLGISNHGVTNSLVKHYFACKEQGIKPILGVEAYFLPKWDEENKRRGFHLCIFAKNVKGYENMNRIQTDSYQYYNPITTFEKLRKYSEGIICSSACVAGLLAQLLWNDKDKEAERCLIKFKKIFGDDFYVEIQPYSVSIEGMQEKVNKKAWLLAKKLGIKCIMTSDSHYGRKEDFPTYLKMHETKGHDIEEIRKTYKHRYMPTEKEIIARFVKMHSKDFDSRKECIDFAKEMIANLQEIEDKVDGDLMDKFDIQLPKFDESRDSLELLVEEIKAGLKKRGKWNKKYWERCKEELEVIKYHNFADYFLIIQDYVRFAKENDIGVGPGRGSGCNCLVNYALGITDVDSLFWGLDYRRFIRFDKKKMPDIDLDFETRNRDRVQRYILGRYPGRSAQICSYGLYKIDNLINDLVKACGVEDENDKKRLKAFLHAHEQDGVIDFETMRYLPEWEELNSMYDNILVHFEKLFMKVKYIGTHAAGVALTEDDIVKYTAIREKDGKTFTSFDLTDLEKIGVIKFDVLGLKSIEIIHDLRKATGIDGFAEWMIDDEPTKEMFKEGKTIGIFQFDKPVPRNMIRECGMDSVFDAAAVSAMNRPGPLSLGTHKEYAAAKAGEKDVNVEAPYYKYIADTYGEIIYQEQIQAIAVNIGGLEWPEADMITKMTRTGSNWSRGNFRAHYKEYGVKFIKNAKKHGMTKEDARRLYDSFFVYSFNKGHAVGYAIISWEMLYYKANYPMQYWLHVLRAEGNDSKRMDYEAVYVQDGVGLILPATINSGWEHEIVNYGGGECIQRGLCTIKNVGPKAIDVITSNGPYLDRADFEEKMEPYRRVVNKRVMDALNESGAFDFVSIAQGDGKEFAKRVKYLNLELMRRTVRL